MSQNDTAVLTAAVGYVFVASPGTARPSPAELKTLDPATFGSQVQTLKVTGSPTGGTFTLTQGTATSALPYNATAAQVQAALEALASVGSGNVSVSGTSISDSAGLDITWVGTLQGKTLVVTGAASLTGGSTPGVTVTVKTAVNGWAPIGHTSRGDMPEFGFDGGDTEVKGTWQNESLREVVTKPVADFLTLFLHQFDTSAFELYYGADSSATAGVFGVANGNVAPLEKAFLVVIVDGNNRVGFYAPKASVRRDDSINMPVDEFASLPVKATFLKYGVANKFEWINTDLFT